MAASRPLILVVDDDLEILEVLSDILQSEGYLVDRARHGREALARLDRKRPDLILLDMMMPVMDGREFYQALRLRDDRDIPLLVLSANRRRVDKEETMVARGYLAKPFELGELLRLVKEVVPAPS